MYFVVVVFIVNCRLQFETKERVWKFICENEQEVTDWIKAINHAMFLADYQSDEERN